MTANDSDVSDGDILTGSQVVRVYGQNLTAPFVTLTFGDVEYTPLTQGEGYIEFILGDNGTATINVDGSPFMSFEVEGIVVPRPLPTVMLIRQSQLGTSSGGDYINPVTVNTKCVQYPYLRNDDYPFYRWQFKHTGTAIEETDFAFHNCTKTDYSDYQDTYVILNCSIDNVDETAWITYKGFIVAVFNYTTD